MSTDKVVFLAPRSDKTDTEWRENLACKGCRNKTFAVEYDQPKDQCTFPVLKCAACGAMLGRIGWADEV